MKIFKILSILLPIVYAKASADEDAGAHGAVSHSWDYKTNGEDWPSLMIPDNTCAGSNQSPIDLKTSWQTKSAKFDNFSKLYTDQTGDIEVVWNGHTSQVSVNKAGQDVQTFKSTHASQTYNASSSFTGVQFHFHHKSEHTVDGKYHDLEMHTVHFPTAKGEVKNGFIASAMGLMFSVNDYTKGVSTENQAIIDGFFESLEWTTTDSMPKVAEVPYGKLMNMADMQNRYTYVGSVTTPPCAQNVYWNVLRTVYPIKQMHLDQFMNQLKRSSLEVTGNNRVIQNATKAHNPFIISENNDNTIYNLASSNATKLFQGTEKLQCQSAENSKTGKADDCNIILNSFMGSMQSNVVTDACCYQFVVAGEKSSSRCASPSTLDGTSLNAMDRRTQLRDGRLVTAICSGAINNLVLGFSAIGAYLIAAN